MNNKLFVVTVLILLAVIVYLFVSAPPLLPEVTANSALIPIETVLTITEAENDSVRALWTQEIVGAGKNVGLAFHEEWRTANFDAGPLPALFLRETAANLEKNPIRLSLFLGSDYPISAANRFTGKQMVMFERIKQTGTPQFFYDETTAMYTAMFADVAVAEPCVACHNAHEQSPKQDWQLNDIMGATTWLYPAQRVDNAEMVTMLTALRHSFRDAYAAYLDKAATFAQPPTIGEKWPRDGYYLPTVDTFMGAINQRTAPATLAAILIATEQSHARQPN